MAKLDEVISGPWFEKKNLMKKGRPTELFQQNIINGALQAKKMGLQVVTLSGFNSANPLRKIGDISLWAESSEYNVVEMSDHIWLLAIVDYIQASNDNEAIK